MATIDTLFKITAAVVGSDAVKALAQQITGVSTAGQNVSRTMTQAALALKAFAASEVVAELSKIVTSSIDLGDQLEKASQKTGIQVDALDKLRKEAQLSGVDFDSLTSGLEKFNKNLEQAAAGKGTAADAFAALGITIRDANGNLKDTNTLVLETADKFKEFADGPAKGAVAMALFGKSGADLIPLLDQGGDAIRGMSTVMTGEFAAASEDFNKNLILTHQNFQDFAIQITKDILPGLVSISQDFATSNIGVQALTVTIQGLESAFVGLSQAASLITDWLGKKFAEITINAQEFYNVLKDIGTLNLKNIHNDISSANDATTAVDNQSWDNMVKNNQGYQNQVGSIWGGSQQPASTPAVVALANKPQINFNSGAVDKLTSQYDAAEKAADKWLLKEQEGLITLQQEGDYIGKTTVEIAQMKDAREFDTQVAEKMLNMAPDQKAAFLEQADAIKQQRQELIQLNYEQSRTFGAGASDFFAKYSEDATDAAAQTKKVFGDAFKGMEDAFVEFAKTGKLNFHDMVDSIIDDLIRINVEENITGPLAQAGHSFFSGSGGGSSLLSGLGGIASAAFSGLKSFFADGGIMTSGGPVALRKYAGGGVANSPQLAMFGEGSMPEAYVPLPDGRSIPVTMQGGGSGVVNNIVIQTPPGTTASKSATGNGTGGQNITITLDNMMAGILGDQNSRTARTLRTATGLSPTLATR